MRYFAHLFAILGVIFIGLAACQTTKETSAPDGLDLRIQKALTTAGENRSELEGALASVAEEQRDGLRFLIAYMPDRDLTQLSGKYLLKNLQWAYKAKGTFSWCKQLPDSVFFNEVLPYASLNERRDDWREDFYERFAPLVSNTEDIREAIKIINHAIMEEVKVKYSTARPKPDQSPYESMDCGLASCTGLSVLLTDAFRAVGIPSRIAGTPNWTTKEGNHNWNEVMVDGQWYFTEYYPSEGLDQGWFLADAGQADPTSKAHWIYASSFKPAQAYFPLVWDEKIHYVHAENVTERYIHLYQQAQKHQQVEEAGKVQLQLVMFKRQGCSMGDDRVAVPVKVYAGKELIFEGKTADAQKDMNDYLTGFVAEGATVAIQYTDAQGKLRQVQQVMNENQTLRLYYQ
ncbi:transglutaminase-like domain-containing protein [Persicobacter psychrovividus]|uniref:Transglutaminase-like domain-containing protein n=1 Tax=Persicobacter psychrovividus TaxID=387638 RepID=A0ABN6LFK4_9BACT|nr:hypothetical protein PEPS_27730 [Persicobacter psychrovividus]